MTEEEARLALLQTELNSIQGAIRSFDMVSIQVKGWCVTAALAIGGFAAAYRKPELLIVGIGAVIGFFFVNCQFHMIQRRFMNKIQRIDRELRDTGIMQALKGDNNFNVTGAAVLVYDLPRDASVSARIRYNLPNLYFEASRVSLFSLYLFVLFCLLVEMIIIWVLCTKNKAACSPTGQRDPCLAPAVLQGQPVSSRAGTITRCLPPA